MRVLIDTNILMDFILDREPYSETAVEIIRLCKDQEIIGCIAAHSALNLFYILRGSYTTDERRDIIMKLSKFLDIVGIDRSKILSALERYDFADFEDCIQSECAAEFSADCIITRNVKDFTASMIPAVTPDDFLAAFKRKEQS